MSKIFRLDFILFFMALAPAAALAEGRLTGSVLGSEWSVDYSTGMPSKSVNTPAAAFDGSVDTFFASYDRHFGWVGLDLGQPCVITSVGYASRDDSLGPGRVRLAVFQGANSPDFSDAIPIHIVTSYGERRTMQYADVDCSLGFRYVRYVGPHDSRCNIAELQFCGYPAVGDSTHLPQISSIPTLVVNTPAMEWLHEDNRDYQIPDATVTIIDNHTIDTQATAGIRGRGNASWNFPKKPFRIKFDEKQSPLGSRAKARKWAVINNYGDKTLMRNRLAFDISERLGMDFTPQCHFVDVVFNGEYLGCYQLCDQVEVNKRRVNITEMDSTCIAGDLLTGGYLVEVDAYASGEDPGQWFNTSRGYSLPVTIKSPDHCTTEQYAYIRSRVSELSQSVQAADFAHPQNGFRRLLDLDSFLKHFIVGELSGNTDTYWSVFLSLERGESTFRTGPVWDFDLAFENDNRTYPINAKPSFIYRYGSAAGQMQQLVTRLLSDSDVRRRLSEIWSYARLYQGLDDDTFDSLIDTYAASLEGSQSLNFVRWPILNSYVHQNPRIYGSYTAEVENVRSFIHARLQKLDQLIGRVDIDALTATSADAAHTPVAIYSLQGIYMGSSTTGLPPGFYIEHSAGGTRKIAVR